MPLVFLSPVFVLINFEIVILIHKSLTQYAPTVYVQHPQSYTRAAYFEQYDDQEYVWPKENNNLHRKRKKYSYYSGSSEFDYETKRLKCKCSCRKCGNNKHSYYEQQKDCCFSFCIKCSNKNNIYDFDYTTQTTTTEASPESYGNLCPSLPWFECYQEIVSIDASKIMEGYTMKYYIEKDEDKDKDKDKEKDKDESKDKDTDKDKDKDKDEDKGKDEDSTTTTTTATSTTTNTTTPTTTPSTNTTTPTPTTTTPTTNTTTTAATTTTKSRVSESTVPYRGNDEGKLLLNSYFPKKKQCLRNNCLRDNRGRKIGRYFYNDLVLRPTVGSTTYNYANY